MTGHEPAGLEQWEVGAAGSGTPAAGNKVAQFSVSRFGGYRVEISAPSDNLAVTMQVSTNGTDWSATSAATTQEVVTNVTVPAKTSQTFELNLRPGVDMYFRILATGGTNMLIRVFDTGLVRMS